MYMAEVTNSLMSRLQSDAFLTTINGLIANQLPERMNLDSITYSDQTKLDAGISWMPKIEVKYNAQLSECTGLNTFEITAFTPGLEKFLKLDDAGDMVVSFAAVLGVGGITCSGSASLDAVGQKVNADPFQATMSVQNLAPKISGKISPKDGKMCLSVTDVELEIRRDMVSWRDIQVNFGSLPTKVPNSFTDLAWDKLPIDGLISSMNSMVVESLKTQLNNMGAEQCF